MNQPFLSPFFPAPFPFSNQFSIVSVGGYRERNYCFPPLLLPSSHYFDSVYHIWYLPDFMSPCSAPWKDTNRSISQWSRFPQEGEAQKVCKNINSITQKIVFTELSTTSHSLSASPLPSLMKTVRCGLNTWKRSRLNLHTRQQNTK